MEHRNEYWKGCLVSFLRNYCPDLPESYVNLSVADFFRDSGKVPDYPGNVKISSCQWKDFMMRLQLCIKETEARVAKAQAQAERKAAERKAAERKAEERKAAKLKAESDAAHDARVKLELAAIKAAAEADIARNTALMKAKEDCIQDGDSYDYCPYEIVSSSDEEEYGEEYGVDSEEPWGRGPPAGTPTTTMMMTTSTPRTSPGNVDPATGTLST